MAREGQDAHRRKGTEGTLGGSVRCPVGAAIGQHACAESSPLSASSRLPATEKPAWTRPASVLDAAKRPRDRASWVDRVKSPPAQATAVAGQGGGVDLALHRERYSSKAT